MVVKGSHKPDLSWLELDVNFGPLETLFDLLVHKKARDIIEPFSLRETYRFVRSDPGTSWWAYTSGTTLMCLRTQRGVNPRSVQEYIWFWNEKGSSSFEEGFEFKVHFDNGTFSFLVRSKGGAVWTSIVDSDALEYLDCWYQREMEEAVRVCRVDIGSQSRN